MFLVVTHRKKWFKFRSQPETAFRLLIDDSDQALEVARGFTRGQEAPSIYSIEVYELQRGRFYMPDDTNTARVYWSERYLTKPGWLESFSGSFKQYEPEQSPDCAKELSLEEKRDREIESPNF